MHSTELAAAGIAEDFGEGGAKVERYCRDSFSYRE